MGSVSARTSRPRSPMRVGPGPAPSSKQRPRSVEPRRIVEPDAVRLTAIRRTPDQLARMQAGLRGVARHGFDSEDAGEVHMPRAVCC